MNKVSQNSLKLLALSSMILGLSACFDSDDDPIEPNVAPVASGATYVTQTETDIVDRFLVIDADGDMLSYETSVEPLLGSVEVRPNGTFTYTPFAELTGADSFTYTVSDGEAAPVSATINITIEPLQLSFAQFSREAFNQEPNDLPLSVNGREFTLDVANQTEYQDLIDAN